MGKVTENAAIQARREYHRKWRAAYKDKVRAYNQKFWEHQAQKAAELGADNKKNAE